MTNQEHVKWWVSRVLLAMLLGVLIALYSAAAGIGVWPGCVASPAIYLLISWAMRRRAPAEPVEAAPMPPPFSRAETWALGLPFVSPDGELQWAPDGWKPEPIRIERTPEIHAAIQAHRVAAKRERLVRCSACGTQHDGPCARRTVTAEVNHDGPDWQRPKVLIVRRDGVLYAESTVTGQFLPLPIGWTAADYGQAVMFREIKDRRHVFVLPSGATTNPDEIHDLFDRINRLHS